MDSQNVQFPNDGKVSVAVREDGKNIPICTAHVDWQKWWENASPQVVFDAFKKAMTVDYQTVIRNVYTSGNPRPLDSDTVRNWAPGMGTSVGLTPTKAADKLAKCEPSVQAAIVAQLLAGLPEALRAQIAQSLNK